MPAKSPAKVNYLNNRDILKQIHLSKNTYCAFLDPVTDHQYDIILPSVTKINQKTVAEARRNRAARLTRDSGVVVDQKKIPNTDLVFRIMTWEHIPQAAKKQPKVTAKKKRIEDIMGWDELPPDDPLADLVDEPVLDPVHVRVNFPPFWHYRVTDHRVPYLVGKSHWQGDLEHGHYCRDHGAMTRRLAEMFMKLCERYATRSNWRGYCVDEQTQALTQSGWRDIDSITEQDQILSYDGQRLAWSKIKSIFRDEFSGLMHRITSRGMDALITPQHRLLTARGLVPAELILESDRVILMAPGTAGAAVGTHSDSMVELAGWIVTEGCYETQGDKIKRITVYQNAGKGADRIRACLDSLDMKYSESTNDSGCITFGIGRADSQQIALLLPKKNLTMQFILSLTPAQRRILIDTMIDGDGWLRKNHNRSWAQKSAERVDMFLALCTLAGIKTNTKFIQDHVSYGKKVDYYTINLFSPRGNTTNGSCLNYHGGKRNGRGLIGRGKITHPNEPTVPYQGRVWCPETEYGCFVARRNGRIYLTGNSYNEEMRGQALLQLSQIGLQFDESKSQNPFAYYTAAITNSFTRILNIEKKMHNIRDDILELNGLNPSWSRQYAQHGANLSGPVVTMAEE